MRQMRLTVYMSEKVKIRKMTIQDFAQVYELGKLSFMGPDKANSYVYNYWSMSALAKFLEDYDDLTYVAERGDEIVGFVLGHPTYEHIEVGYLEWIAVSPNAQRLGLASKLIQKMLKAFEARGLDKIVTDVKGINIASTKLFEKHGFQVKESVSFLEKTI